MKTYFLLKTFCEELLTKKDTLFNNSIIILSIKENSLYLHPLSKKSKEELRTRVGHPTNLM